MSFLFEEEVDPRDRKSAPGLSSSNSREDKEQHVPAVDVTKLKPFVCPKDAFLTDDSTWLVWDDLLQGHCEAQGVDLYLRRPIRDRVDQNIAQWIRTSVSPAISHRILHDLVKHLVERPTAHDLYQFVKRICNSTTTAKVMQVLDSLLTSKCKETESLQDFVIKFDANIHVLEVADCKLPDLVILFALIRAVPSRLRQVALHLSLQEGVDYFDGRQLLLAQDKVLFTGPVAAPVQVRRWWAVPARVPLR